MIALGWDPAQTGDFSALVLVESVRTAETWSVPQHRILGMARFPPGTGYPEQVKAVADLAASTPGVEVFVDATGVGRPVLDLLRQSCRSPVRGLLITSGSDVNDDDQTLIRVPKRTLVSTLAVVLQTRRLHALAGSALSDVLARELSTFQVRLSESANDSYAAAGSAHDDLVLALAYAVWAGERQSHGQGAAFLAAWQAMAAQISSR